LNNGGKMKEINFSKTNRNIFLVINSCLFCICIAVAVAALYYFCKARIHHVHEKYIVEEIVSIIAGLLFAKFLFEDIITLLRFYDLEVEMLGDKLILRTNTKKCEIPMTKDTNVMYCMSGWLISWPSEKGYSIILLTENLLEGHFLDLCFYFQENTNYIPSRGIIHRSKFGIPIGDINYYQPNADYDAAAEDEKKLLKSLKINKWNRLKYMKWPS
jgi:hypothetical protein